MVTWPSPPGSWKPHGWGAQRHDAHETHADVTEVAPERCCSLICHRRRGFRNGVGWRKASGPPLDGAAHARPMWFGHRLTGQHMGDGGTELRSGDRLAVARCGLVERTAIGKPALRVVEEEVRGAGCGEGPADSLISVQQVRESPGRAPRLIGQSLGPIFRVSLR